MTAPAADVAARRWRRLAARVVAYGWLGSTCRVSNFLGLVVAATLIPASRWGEARTVLLSGLSVVLCVAGLALASTLDQLQGLKDGSDRRNYAASDAAGLRSFRAKPLVAGVISVPAARRFAVASAVLTAVALVAVAVVVRDRSPWTVPSLALVTLACIQYSAGLRLSYVGGQEALLVFGYGASVLFPVVLVTGEIGAGAVVAGVLVGLWHLQVSVFSNQWDAEGDRAVDRRTLAVRLDDRRYRRFVTLLFILDWVILTVAVAAEWLPRWAIMFLVPWAVLQGRQVRTGLWKRAVLQARVIGFRAVWAGALGLATANVVAQAT